MAAAESSSSVASAEVLTVLAWKIELVLKEDQKLAIFSCSLGEMLLYGCQRDSGRASVSKCFCFCSSGTLGWDS